MHVIFLPRPLLTVILCLSISGLFACGGDSPVEGYDAVASGGLDSCPDPIIIHPDWFPESESGATYELFGGGTYLIDNENRSVAGTLHDGEVDTGLGLEVRTGGPAIGFTPVASHMYTDTSIPLGYAITEGQITRFNSAPLLSVVAPLESPPKVIMWDPDTSPDA
jgi:hypothetical protein